MNLTQAAFDRLNGMFREYNHRPSKDQLTALRAIQDCLTMMVNDEAGHHYYLSSLDPGVGKTSAIVSWIKAYLDAYKENCPQGILICVDRLTEIWRYVTDCNLPHDSFAVVAGKTEEALNSLGLGHKGINNALVLFTTKEQIRKRSQGVSIDEQSIFHFNGQPRAVKVWDESLSVGKDIVINPYDFGRLYTPLASASEDIVSMLQLTMQSILACASGTLFTLPVLPDLPRDFFDAPVWKKRNHDRELLELLWRISGQTVLIRKDRGTQLIIDCVQSIPNDFPPCLILDASGRIKGTYKVQQRKLDNLKILPYSNKSYRNLSVEVWRRAGGRGIAKDFKVIIPELVKIINTRPDNEEILFLLYQDQLEILKESLRKNLPESTMKRISYCTWGQHTATNEFCNIQNIIALSAYQYPDPTYDAMTRAAGLMTVSKGVFPTQDEINMVKKGEISSDFLQGVTRGKPRKSEGDTCPPCRLWLIAHPKTGLEKELPVIFPECTVTEWKTQGYSLTKTQQKAFDIIKEKLKAGLQAFPAAPIRKQLTMRQDNFKRMMESRNFKEALESLKVSYNLRKEGMYFQIITP